MRPATAVRHYRLLGGARLAAVLFAAPLLCGCYLTHLAKGQAKLSSSSISIEEALKRGDLSRRDKDALLFIQDVREFAETRLRLKESDNYTTYYPGEKKPFYWVLTAAPRDSLEPLTWSFPVTGAVSYRGYFDLEEAGKERDRLAGQGYDVYLRPALAYSTLGWFTDPVVPLMLDMDPGNLAELIIHELTHGTVYVSGQTTFSESLAQFVGRQGAIEYLNRRFGHASAEVMAHHERIADERLYDRFMRDAAVRLKEMYAARPADLEKARREFFDGMRRDLDELRPRFRTAAYARISLDTLNNAVMTGRLAYADTEPFEQAFESVGRDWQRFFDLVRLAAEDDEPIVSLLRLIRP